MLSFMESKHPYLLAPSLLAGDHGNLRASIQEIENAQLEWVHLDIMDGHFVPNLSFGPQSIKALRPDSKLFFDVHLMLDNPHKYIDAFVDAGADQITIHVEPDYPVMETLEKIQSHGCKRGVVLNPDTPADAAKPFLQYCDIVLLMTVQPGFGGQSFRQDVLPKIKQISAWREEMGLDFRLEVDGGVLTGRLAGPVTDAGVKAKVLSDELEGLGGEAHSLAAGDGANDIPMIEAASYGFAYRAKPKARAAANGRIDRGDLTAILSLFGIPRADWVERV